ncbi:MAG: DNA polymerase III subunit gamma and tau, partial [Streptosporangiaceae bacterium]
DPGTPAGPAGPAATRAAARAAARPAGRGAAGRPTAGGAAPDWVPQPDDEVEDSDSDALSGTDLIARELGGQVIEEFGET